MRAMVKPSCNGLYDALDTLAFNYYSVVKPLLDAGGGGVFYTSTLKN